MLSTDRKTARLADLGLSCVTKKSSLYEDHPKWRCENQGMAGTPGYFDRQTSRLTSATAKLNAESIGAVDVYALGMTLSELTMSGLAADALWELSADGKDVTSFPERSPEAAPNTHLPNPHLPGCFGVPSTAPLLHPTLPPFTVHSSLVVLPHAVFHRAA